MKYLLALITILVSCSLIQKGWDKLKDKVDTRPRPDGPVCEKYVTLTSSAKEWMVFGDGIGTSKFPAIAKKIIERSYGYAEGIYLGDVYEDGLREDKQFYDLIYNPLKPMVTYLSTGNHGAKNSFLRTEGHIKMPCMYYAIKSPRFSFFVFNTEDLTPKQMADAEEFLCNNPNPVGVGHRSLLTYDESHGNEREHALMRPVEELLHKCGAKIMLTGHSHVLEHTVTPLGIHNFVSGGAGRGTRGLNGSGLFSKSSLGFGKLKKAYFKFYDDKGKELYRYDF